MNKAMSAFIVSTDLDGTFLDHHTYEWQAALPAVRLLEENNIPIIFNTSKTFEEVLALQDATGLHGPAIVENGSALFLPKGDYEPSFFQQQNNPLIEHEDYWQVTFGSGLTQIKSFINEWRETHGKLLEGYSDWSIDKIMEVTSLPRDKAQLSASKQFSEPFHWHGNDEQLTQLREDAAKHSLQILQGGRFFHLQGLSDKAQPLLWLKQQYQHYFELTEAQSPKLICLGDNKNDIQMLNVADFPVCVKSPVSPYPELRTEATVFYTEGLGPVGWDEAIQSILEQHNKTQR